MPWAISGAEKTTRNLSAMIGNGRLPHALLFTGPSGIGKNILARALARALNCRRPDPDGAPCGLCVDCSKIKNDTHPDVQTLAPSGRTGQIKIEDIRELRSTSAFRPYEGRSKVFIIRRADRLNPEAGNALLKTLEEPSPDSHFILTSASETELMPTILSRCLRLSLTPWPDESILDLLAQRRSLTGPRAALLAALANGAPGAALEIDPEAVWRPWEELNRLMELESAARLAAAWNWIQTQVGRDREDREAQYPFIISLLRLWFREALLARIRGASSPLTTSVQTRWAGLLDGKTVDRIRMGLAQLEDSLKRFVNPELALENFWLTVLMKTF